MRHGVLLNLLETLKLYLYDIKFSTAIRSLSQFVEPILFYQICDLLGFRTCPFYFAGPFSQEVLDKFTDGQTQLGFSHVREGIVIEANPPRFDPELGRVILKSVSENYYLRKNQTDNVE